MKLIIEYEDNGIKNRESLKDLLSSIKDSTFMGIDNPHLGIYNIKSVDIVED